MRHFVFLICGILAAAAGSGDARAQEDSEAEARSELRLGFALRKEGRFAEALPHLAQSYRLAPQVKALLNMADCEEHMGRLLDAEQHWVSARDLAAARGDGPARDESVERLQALEPRIPRLTIDLADGGSSGAVVTRDGVPVPRSWLGVALPSDAGPHVVQASADGYEPWSITVELAERDNTRVEVSLLPLRATPVVAAPEPRATLGVRPPTPILARLATHPAHEPSVQAGMPLLSVGLGVVGLGLAGIALGTVEGIRMQQDRAAALADCRGDCATSVSAQLRQGDARNAAAIANVGFVAGGLVAGTGGALVIWAAAQRPPRAPLRATGAPFVRLGLHGIVLGLVF